MQSSYRWFRLGSAVTELSSAKLRKKALSLSSEQHWFTVPPNDPVEADLRYFRRSEVLLEQYDSSGNQFFARAESITSTGLNILERRGSVLLRVSNPGRNMRSLLSALEDAVGFGFWASAVTFEHNELTDSFNDLDLKKIIGLKVIDVIPVAGCVGRMEFASKEGIELSSLPLLDGLSFKFDHIKFEVIHKGLRGHGALSSNGLVKASGELAPRIRDSIERKILKTLK